MDKFTTVIIPSLGRESLKKCIDSLKAQTDPDYKVIIVYDGAPVNIFETDYEPGLVTTIQLPTRIGHAGLVRNVAIPLVTTPWISFLDDDDFFDPTYIERLKFWDSKGYDLVSFTYKNLENGNTQPPLGSTEMRYCNIGISFSIKNDFVRKNNILFQNRGCEDYFLLDDARTAGAKWVVTNEILYWVSKRSVWQ
jgi:glycosyltransferase involved in cell wall biosynthesis